VLSVRGALFIFIISLIYFHTLLFLQNVTGDSIINRFFFVPSNMDLIDNIPPIATVDDYEKMEKISPFLRRSMPKALKAAIPTEYWFGRAQELD